MALIVVAGKFPQSADTGEEELPNKQPWAQVSRQGE